MSSKINIITVIITMCILSLFVIVASMICVFSLYSFYNNRYKWLAIGDSITYGEGDNGRSYADCIAKSHNNISVEKKAIGGLRTKELVIYAQNGYLETEKKPDLVTVLIGTNDYGTNVNLEEYENDLVALIDTLKGLFPDIKIVLLTPLYRDYFGKRTNIIPSMVNENGNTLYEYAELIKKNAIQRGVDVLELNEEDYINKDNLRELTVDGLHPNQKGYKLIAENVYNELKNNKQVGL